MPELPEVETIRQGIASEIIGKKIINVIIRHHQLRWPIDKNLPEKLINQTVKNVSRRGKYLLLFLDRVGVLQYAPTLIIHLGMSGSLQLLSKGHSVKKHDHVDIIFADDKCLRFNDPRRFGAIIYTEQDPFKHKLLAHLGPEPFDLKFNDEYLFLKSRNRTTAIKIFIMDSKIVTGVGNIYASETLFLSKIKPTIFAKNLTLENSRKLVAAIKSVLTNAIKHGGTTFRDYKNSKGEKGLFITKLNVYGRAGLPCKKCGTKIKEIRIGQRSTYYCPHCQN